MKRWFTYTGTQKSEEALKFSENEPSSPLIGIKTNFDDTATFDKDKELYSPDGEQKQEKMVYQFQKVNWKMRWMFYNYFLYPKKPKL